MTVKAPTKSEKAHMASVAQLPCVICLLEGFVTMADFAPVVVHHIREGQGCAQRAGHRLTLPLCPPHHDGDHGIHGLGRGAFERRYKVTELDLLDFTYELLEAA